MSLRKEQLTKVCMILDDVLANRPTERDSLIAAVRKAFDALDTNEWIPVTERLPGDRGQVLVFADSTHFALAKYEEMRQADSSYEYEWVTFDAWKPLYRIKNVRAWRPLPEPWKG